MLRSRPERLHAKNLCFSNALQLTQGIIGAVNQAASNVSSACLYVKILSVFIVHKVFYQEMNYPQRSSLQNNKKCELKLVKTMNKAVSCQNSVSLRCSSADTLTSLTLAQFDNLITSRHSRTKILILVKRHCFS